MPPKVFGHRGAPVAAVENTLDSIEAAIEAGADGVEIDVRLTADHVPVLLHDATLDRTQQGRGAVRVARLAETRVATLEELFERIAGRCSVNIEIKDSAAWPYAREIITRQTRTESWISSFDLELMRIIASEGFPVGLLFSGRRGAKPEDILRAAEEINPLALHLPPELFFESEKTTYVWTINDPAEARDLVNRGAAGIFTDDPALMISNLRGDAYI